MNKYKSYNEAEAFLIRKVVIMPDFITKSTYECIGTGFVLTDPTRNKNNRSNYEYADEFFKWVLSGEKQLSDKLIQLNPWVRRFVDSTNLPESFSATYGWKIKEQLPEIELELKSNYESRRAYVNILSPYDHPILRAKTTHEFPCTIGFQLFIREGALHMMVNMRSNNVYSVMPYDVYNFTSLQAHLANKLQYMLGNYYHQINNAHIFKGDVRRINEQLFTK